MTSESKKSNAYHRWRSGILARLSSLRPDAADLQTGRVHSVAAIAACLQKDPMKKVKVLRGELAAKPRNPYALAARLKAAGSHERHQTSRTIRRREKQQLNARIAIRDLADD